MITRSKLIEQLRELQIRSQHKWSVLSAFSPKPQIVTRQDVVVALIYVLIFCSLIVSCYAALSIKHLKISAMLVCLGILLPTCLKISRHRWLARKRKRRMLLPLSM